MHQRKQRAAQESGKPGGRQQVRLLTLTIHCKTLTAFGFFTEQINVSFKMQKKFQKRDLICLKTR